MDLTTIQTRIRMIEELEAENKTLKDMLKSELENNEDYCAAHAQAKEAITKRRVAKEKAFSDPGCEKSIMDIKANNEEIATLREILSTELTEYYSKEGTDKIIGHDGRPRKFKITVRLSSNSGE